MFMRSSTYATLLSPTLSFTFFLSSSYPDAENADERKEIVVKLCTPCRLLQYGCMVSADLYTFCSVPGSRKLSGCAYGGHSSSVGAGHGREDSSWNDAGYFQDW